MKIILKQDVEGLGKRGEVQEVKPGYARNFLIPQGLAQIATAGKLKQIKKQKDYKQKVLEAIINKINNKSITIKAKAGEKGKLFGTITSEHIANQIKKKYKVDINKTKILLENPIKSLGIHQAKLKLGAKLQAQVKVLIKASKK